MRSQVLAFLYVAAIFYAIWTLLSLLTSSQPTTFAESRDCILRATRDVKSDASLWAMFPDVVNDCSVEKELKIKSFANTDEAKFHIMPKKKAFGQGKKCTIISLGIGKDVEAEKAMRDALPSCNFYGADPVNETNADIFPEVGKFFNIAVGAENGTFRSYILEDIYRYQEVKYVDIATFIRREVRRDIIDQLMVDIEHAEYPLLPFFLKNGQLAKDGVTICQMNIEIHRPNEKQMAEFAHFFKEIMRERNWSFISTSTIIGHLRLYMVNNGSDECRRRYFEETSAESEEEEDYEEKDDAL